MSMVESGYGWSVDSAYAVNESGVLLDITSGRSFSWTGTGFAFVVHVNYGYSGPVVVSTEPLACKYNQGNTSYAPESAYEYLGFTWYTTKFNYMMSGNLPSTGGITQGQPVITLSGAASASSTQTILEAVRPVLSVPSFEVAFNSNGGSGSMADQRITIDEPTALQANTFTKEDAAFQGWATTPNGRVVYRDEEVVENLAGEDETITLYAVWRDAPPTIILQYNETDREHLDKEITDLRTLYGYFREECTVEDPAFIVEADPSALAGCNYFSLPKLNRHYFLTGWTIVRTNLIEIRGHVDVLTTYASQIREQRAIVKRQENDNAYNLYINDSSLKAYQNPYVITKAFPNGFEGFTYVLAVAGVRGATPVNPPGAIMDLTVASTAGTYTGYKLTFTWTAPADVDGYSIYMREGIDGSWSDVTNYFVATTWIIDNFIARGGVTYYFKVVATNAFDTRDSNIVSFSSANP